MLIGGSCLKAENSHEAKKALMLLSFLAKVWKTQRIEDRNRYAPLVYFCQIVAIEFYSSLIGHIVHGWGDCYCSFYSRYFPAPCERVGNNEAPSFLYIY